jgi:cytidylate kinase
LDERSVIAELERREGFSGDYLAETIERPPSLGQSLIADLARASAMVQFSAWQPPDEIIIESVRTLVFEYAAKGHVVVIGHGGPSLLGWRPAGVRVLAILLRAGRRWRIAQLGRRYAIDEADAQRRIERTDEARQRYQMHYFKSDMYDSRQYDLVLNTEALGLELAIAVVTKIAVALAA